MSEFKNSTWSDAQLSQGSPEWSPHDLCDIDLNLLDSVGCLIIRAAVPGDVVAHMNGIINRHIKQSPEVWAQRSADIGCPTKLGFMQLSPLFFSAMEHPVLLEIAPYMLGPGFRFDSAVCVQMEPELNAHANLHGGPRPGKFPITFYKSGLPLERKIARTSQLKFGIQLTEQTRATGGFCYIPGTHASSDYGDVNGLAAKMDKLLLRDALVIPSLQPGDVFIFIDSLVHGCTEQKSELRRALYYSYCSGFAAMHPYEEEIKALLPLAQTPIQQRLLRPPYEKVNDKVTYHSTWREDTV